MKLKLFSPCFNAKAFLLLLLLGSLTGCGGAGTESDEPNTQTSQAASSDAASSIVSVTKSSKSSTASSVASTGASSAVSKDVTPPAAPVTITKNLVTPNKVELSWTASTDNVGITGYKVYRNQVLLATLDANTLSYTDTTVSPNTTYSYGVIAGDAAGLWSSLKSVSTKTLSLTSGSNSSITVGSSSSASSDAPKSSDTQAPTLPANPVKNILTDVKISFSWTKATDNVAVTNYRIYRNQVLIAEADGSQTSFTDDSLAPDTSYTFSVSAGDAADNWSAQKSVAVKTPKSTVVNGSAIFEWTIPTERENGSALDSGEVGGYEIRYKLKSASSFTTVVIGSGLTDTYTLDNLSGDYEFEIAAFDVNELYSQFVSLYPI